MIRRLRASFAAKLLVGALVLAIVLIGGISGYLIVSRNAQTVTAALSNSDNRAATARQGLESITGDHDFRTAQLLAAQQPLIAALSAPDPRVTVQQLFAQSTSDLSGHVLLITDPSGVPLYSFVAPDLGGVSAVSFQQSAAVTEALRGRRCAIVLTPAGGPAAGACGVDVTSGVPTYDVAVPVVSGGTTLGVVAYVAPLPEQLSSFSSLFQFPTAFIPVSSPQTELRLTNLGRSTALGSITSGTTPNAIAGGIASRANLVHATYTAPLDATGSTGEVAGSFAAVTAPDGRTIAGYVGVEVPLAPFIGDERTDELTLAVITVFALLLMVLLIIVFVEVVVRRPIRRLERGVARIAGGDYAARVTVHSRDELGRLATSVNHMGDSIAQYTSEIESARARLDSAVERISGVSRALTTTTGGVAALQREVVRTAAAIAGERSTAALALRQGGELVVQAVHPGGGAATDLRRWNLFPRVLRGEVVRQTAAGGALLAVPMFYQNEVVGALAVIVSDTSRHAAEDEEDVLVVLANNAAIAMENTRLYEQEKETVHRLRQLDAMKTDFLATIQHELRTPLTAILGLSDLIDMCWDRWEDAPKLEAVRDIQVAARNLYDIVETIIDFNAVEGATVVIHPGEMLLGDAVAHAVELVGERYKGGLPVPVDIEVPGDLAISADAERFNQVLRAIVDNAVKFSDGNGRVHVRACPSARAGFVRIEVTDQGIGIAAEDVPRVFDRFYQVDNSATRRYGGTGMGLALVKRLVVAHGATVDIESEAGAGTRVVLEWPATGGASSPATGAPGNGSAPQTAPHTAPPVLPPREVPASPAL